MDGPSRCPQDPAQALSPYRPEQGQGPWDRRAAAHLLRRALGGARPGDLDRALDEGVLATIERLCAPTDESQQQQLAAIGESLSRGGDRLRLAAWWLLKMIDERSAMGSRLALFWHGLFACAHGKVKDLTALFDQHQLFLSHGSGPFGTLADKMVRDPALLRFLDGDLNRRGLPNENLARELLELFTLGEGAYTEQDIREGARALTGSSLGRDGYRFIPEHHDPDPKTVLGRTLDDGRELASVAVDQAACPLWLAGRIWRFYVSPQPPPEVLELLAERWREQDLRLDWLLQTLLSSRAFFSAESRRSLVKSPVDYVVGALRAMAVRTDLLAVARACDEMGQRLFDPPGVQGWAGGEAWIHAAAWIARVNFAARLAPAVVRQREMDSEGASGRGLAGWPGQLIEDLLDDDLTEDRRQRLLQLGGLDSEAATTVQAILCAAEYHLS